MITGGRTQARDEVFTLVKEAIDPTGYPVIWQDRLQPAHVDSVLFMVHMQHVTADQAAFPCEGSRRREVSALLNVTIRVPVEQGGLTLADNLATIVENALFGKATPNGVWFREVVGREVPPKDGNSQTLVSAEIVYQEII